MAYKALYRTYRPSNFDEVAGQEHIVKTLKNALSTNKLAHAYLFAGPRSTGKTTMAKILAKALNCDEGLATFVMNALPLMMVRTQMFLNSTPLPIMAWMKLEN